MVSAGAALALTNELSVKDFLSQAAFGVEIRTSQGASRAQVLLDSSGSHKVTKKIMDHHGAEIVITCYPLAPLDNRETLAIKGSYEMELLGREYQGVHTWELKYEHNPLHVDCQDYLVLKQQSWPTHKPSFTEEQLWPIFYDPGSCVLFIDRNLDGPIKNNSDLQNRIGVSEEPRSKKGVAKRKQWRRNQADSPGIYWQDALCESIETPASEDGKEARYPPSQHTIRENAAAPMSQHSKPLSTTETTTKASNGQLPSPVMKEFKRKAHALPNGEVDQKRPKKTIRVANTDSRVRSRLSAESDRRPSSQMSAGHDLGTTTRPIEVFDGYGDCAASVVGS